MGEAAHQLEPTGYQGSKPWDEDDPRAAGPQALVGQKRQVFLQTAADRRRECTKLYLFGKTKGEIVAETGIPLRSVYRYIDRGLELLRGDISADGLRVRVLTDVLAMRRTWMEAALGGDKEASVMVLKCSEMLAKLSIQFEDSDPSEIRKDEIGKYIAGLIREESESEKPQDAEWNEVKQEGLYDPGEPAPEAPEGIPEAIAPVEPELADAPVAEEEPVAESSGPGPLTSADVLDLTDSG